MRLKKFLLPFAVIALALGLAACGNGDEEAKDGSNQEEQIDQEAIDEMNKKMAEQQVEEDKIVAVVNDEELNGQQYNTVLQNMQSQYQQMGVDPTTDEIGDQIQSQTLDEIVNQTLLLQQAHAAEIKVSDEEIDEEYNMLVDQFSGEETLDKMLKDENIEKEAFRERIADSLLYSKYIEHIAPAEEVSDEDVKAYYDEIAAQSEGDEDAELPPLEDLSDMIRSSLAQEAQQKKIMAHIEELKEDANIELKM